MIQSSELNKPNTAVTPSGAVVDTETGALITPPPNFTITSTDLKSSPDIKFQTQKPEQLFPIKDIPIPELSETKPEKQANELSTKLQELNERLLGQSTFRTTKEKEYSVEGLRKTQQGFINQLKMLQAEAEATKISPEFEQKNVLAPLAEGERARKLRDVGVRALIVGANLQAAQGDLSGAFDQVERAVAQKFDPIKEEIAIKTANLDLILKSPDYSLEDKKRAQKQKNIQDANDRIVERQKEDYKAGQAMILAATKLNSGNQSALIAAQQAVALDPKKSDYLTNVLKLVGKYQSDPQQIIKDLDIHLKAQQDILESQKKIAREPLERQKLQAEIDKINAERKQISSGGLTPFQTISVRNQIEDNLRQNPAVAAYGQLVNFGIPVVIENFKKGQTDNVSDVLLMRSLAKITDPTTGVREEEYRTFEDAQGALNRIYKLPSNWVGKGKLTDTGRTAMVREIQDRYDSRLNDYVSQYEYYKNQGNQSGVSIPPPYKVSKKIENGGLLKSPDGKKQVDISDLTSAQIEEAKKAGWR